MQRGSTFTGDCSGYDAAGQLFSLSRADSWLHACPKSTNDCVDASGGQLARVFISCSANVGAGGERFEEAKEGNTNSDLGAKARKSAYWMEGSKETQRRGPLPPSIITPAFMASFIYSLNPLTPAIS